MLYPQPTSLIAVHAKPHKTGPYFFIFLIDNQFLIDCGKFTHTHQGCFTGTGTAAWLSQSEVRNRVVPYEDVVASTCSRYLRQGYAITSRSLLWDVITFPCLRYMLLVTYIITTPGPSVYFIGLSVQASAYLRLGWCILIFASGVTRGEILYPITATHWLIRLLGTRTVHIARGFQVADIESTVIKVWVSNFKCDNDWICDS